MIRSARWAAFWRAGKFARLFLPAVVLLSGFRVAGAQPPKPAEAAAPAAQTRGADDPASDPAAEVDEVDVELPRLEDLELPSFQRLMAGPPVDRIVLSNQRVVEVEPLYPRPGALEDLKTRIEQAMLQRGANETEGQKRKRLAMYNLPLTLPDGDFREYQLHIRFIRQIVYYEELILARVDQLLDARQVRQAYELLVALDEPPETWKGLIARRDPQDPWPGAVPRRERLLLTEARVQFDAGQSEQALAILESLHERNKAYPGLDDQLGAVFDRLMSDALARGDARQARFFLRRLARRIPGHKVVPLWTGKLMQRTRELLAESAAAEKEGRDEAALDLAEAAARTWPDLPELLPVYNRLASRRQRLPVGVIDLPAAAGAPAPPARPELTQTWLFRPGRVDDKIARFESPYFQEWDPAELGHSVIFRLRGHRAAGDSLPLVTAATLSEAFAGRLDSAAAGYDARFAAAVSGLEVRGPFDLAVRFRQAPLRPEALFSFPYQPAAEATLAALSPAGGAPAGPEPPTYPFRRVPGTTEGRVVYRRTAPETGTASRHVEEVIEIGYPSHERAIQGLLRGEVSLLPRIPISTVKSFAARNEFFTQPYGLPTTHLLQFHPRSRTLQSRALRRALIYALDRRRMLDEVFLREADSPFGRLISAPWPTTIYAYNRFVIPHGFDPALAYSLARNAEKELKEKPPPLRLWVADDPEIRAAADQIVAAWKRIGIETQRVAFSGDRAAFDVENAQWDVAYRSGVIAEPLIDLWPLIALTRSTETSALGYLPTWLRHDLLELDRIGDWRSAEQLLHKLHRQFWAEVHLIPLWELDEHFVVRKNIRNVPDRPLRPYQHIAQWKVEPWFARD